MSDTRDQGTKTGVPEVVPTSKRKRKIKKIPVGSSSRKETEKQDVSKKF